MPRKIYVVGNSTSYASWMQGVLVKDMTEADLVVFTGGEDVTPSYYGQEAHPSTFNRSARDAYELTEFNKARELNKPLIGICRGAQFLCAMSGGILIQHQGQPGYTHDMKLEDGRTIRTSSEHHQAQFPFLLPKEDYRIMAWTENMCGFHQGAGKVEMNPPVECEVVYYRKTNALGIQGHPEWMSDTNDPESMDYFRTILNQLLASEL